MSKHKPCRARRPAWVDTAIAVLWREVATTLDARHRLNAMAEAVLLDVVFSYTQSSSERVLAAHRKRMNSDDPDRGCVGVQSYKALATDAGVSPAAIRWANADLEVVNAISSNPAFNYTSRGYRDDNSYSIGAGSYLDQIRALMDGGRHVAAPVAVCASLLAALDPEAPDGDVAHMRLDQLTEAADLSADTVRKVAKAEILARRFRCVAPDQFRFIADKSKEQPSVKPVFSVSSRRRKVVLGAENSVGRGNQNQDGGGNYRKARKVVSGAESSGNTRSPISLEHIPRLNSDISSYSYRSSVGARRCAPDAAACRTPVVVPARRLSLDDLRALAITVIAGRSLTELSDDEAYSLMLQAVAERMPPNVMRRSEQRTLGLELFRKLASQWPTSLAHAPEVAFTFLWTRVENKPQSEAIKSWRYFRDAVPEFVAKFALPPTYSAPPVAPPALSPQTPPRQAEVIERPFLAPTARDEATMADRMAWTDQRDAVRALELELGESGIAEMLDEVQGLQLPFGDPDKSWGKAGRLRGRQCLLNRLVKAHRRGLDFRWMWILLTTNYANPRITARNWTGVGEIIDAALTRIDAERQQMEGDHAQVENRPI